ncbi:hypothetical protein Nepgr_008930 [Nepenthes gracilis]|uniref:Fungal lipase-type domain-containing protein n=1 Tax=Nepenthes gracilis TaxID=150966 RepID=A0AAD3SA09_NEPGR|nr:hypothetical protein Nepgr_008930 [Nepenthes gracilis]
MVVWMLIRMLSMSVDLAMSPSPNWRDLINSSWKDENYKRTVVACFIQAVYLLELDRQENRKEENGLAPKWWLPFKYKLIQTLIDERDGTIFGAILEWDSYSALANFVIIRPSGAPRVVLALRGTLLKGPTIRRDLEDDFRFLAWESLKGSVRFKQTFEALKAVTDKYRSSDICVAGHSLGAGLALQVGKELAKQGIYVEAHLFNPPSFSIAMSLRDVGEKVGIIWKRFKSMLPSGSSVTAEQQQQQRNGLVASTAAEIKWVPHLYVNNSDYICCRYTDSVTAAQDESSGIKDMAAPVVAAKLYVLSKGKQKFLDAHGLEQWWADDLELQTIINSSKLISKQLKSLYSLPTPQQAPAGLQQM